jgi:hypothetical protein
MQCVLSFPVINPFICRPAAWLLLLLLLLLTTTLLRRLLPSCWRQRQQRTAI